MILHFLCSAVHAITCFWYYSLFLNYYFICFWNFNKLQYPVMVKSGSFGLAFCLDQNSILFSYNSTYVLYIYWPRRGFSAVREYVQYIKTSFLVHYILYTHRVRILEGHSAVHSRLFGWSFTWLSF